MSRPVGRVSYVLDTTGARLIWAILTAEIFAGGLVMRRKVNAIELEVVRVWQTALADAGHLFKAVSPRHLVYRSRLVNVDVWPTTGRFQGAFVGEGMGLANLVKAMNEAMEWARVRSGKGDAPRVLMPHESSNKEAHVSPVWTEANEAIKRLYGWSFDVSKHDDRNKMVAHIRSVTGSSRKQMDLLRWFVKNAAKGRVRTESSRISKTPSKV